MFCLWGLLFERLWNVSVQTSRIHARKVLWRLFSRCFLPYLLKLVTVSCSFASTAQPYTLTRFQLYIRSPRPQCSLAAHRAPWRKCQRKFDSAGRVKAQGSTLKRCPTQSQRQAEEKTQKSCFSVHGAGRLAIARGMVNRLRHTWEISLLPYA